MEEAFVIMKIGDKELNKIWNDVYEPVIRQCGLDPKRVDKHNEGDLLMREIEEFIKRAKIIIADLTGERPNCYIEAGYAIGIGKSRNLIFCCKSDEKVHFDLSGYEVIRWDTNNMELFRNDLTKKIMYRLKVVDQIRKKSEEKETEIKNWIDSERKIAIEELSKSGIGDGYIEVIFLPVDVEINKRQDEIKEIARRAECHNTGWPIGVVLDRPGYAPIVTTDGIRSIIKATPHFDYWMLRKDGCFYFLRNLDAEIQSPNKVLYFDIRIWRVAEVFLYCSRLYKEFGLRDTEKVKIHITHSGLKDRVLTANNPGRLWPQRNICSVDEPVKYDFVDTLDNISKSENIKLNGNEVVQDLFVRFDFAVIDKNAIDSIVDEFLKRRT